MKREIGMLIFGIIIGAFVVLAMWQIHETRLIEQFDRDMYLMQDIKEEC